jgi:hypothetical protein
MPDIWRQAASCAALRSLRREGAGPQSRTVLAGDWKQLGPVVRSATADRSAPCPPRSGRRLPPRIRVSHAPSDPSVACPLGSECRMPPRIRVSHAPSDPCVACCCILTRTRPRARRRRRRLRRSGDEEGGWDGGSLGLSKSLVERLVSLRFYSRPSCPCLVLRPPRLQSAAATQCLRRPCASRSAVPA